MQTLGHSTTFADTARSTPMLQQVGLPDRLKLALICGALLGFSSAGYGVWWLAWVGLAPLLLLVFGSRSRTEAMLTGLVFGFAYHLLGLRFILDLYPMTWLAGWGNGAAGALAVGQLWAVESLHQALLTAAFALFVRTLPMRPGYLPALQRPYFPLLLSVPLIWIFLQWIVAPSPLFLGVPLDQLAYSQAREPSIIQIARYGGAQAVDFMLLLVNTAIAAVLLETTNIGDKFARRTGLMAESTGAMVDLLVALLICAAACWLGRQQVLTDAAMPVYFQSPPPDAKPIDRQIAAASFAPAFPVAVLHGNQSPQAGGGLPNAGALQYLSLVSNLGASLVVLPSCLPNGLNGSADVAAKLAGLARLQRKDVIVGWRQRSESGIQDGVHAFTADGSTKENDYFKYRLLPVVEWTPIGFLNSLVPESIRQHFSGGDQHIKGVSLNLVRSVFGQVGATMNEEVVYPDLIASQVNRGASLLVSVSDLSSFHRSILGQELLAAAVLRAVENGRYFVISSIGGESAVIDPCGVVTSAGMPGETGVLLDRVQFLHKKTPYSRMCVWTPLYH